MSRASFDEINDQISDFIDAEERDLKFRLGDSLVKLQFDFTPTIAYDYLNITDDLDFSFHHSEFHLVSSEENPQKSDYQIYFEKVKLFCTNTLDDSLNNSDYREHLKLVSPNKNLLDVVKKIFNVDYISPEQMPQFGELGLYTNKQNSKSPRIFFFIGNIGIVYMLFYDPFHLIFNSKK